MSEIFTFPPNPEQEPTSPSQEIATYLGEKYGEEHGFDADTLSEIAAQPFELAYETAYSHLSSAGLSEEEADRAMAPWIQSENQDGSI
ncbi:MAG TPA: hypothetical protein VF733_04535 [Candidatus Saccharimonadales bacterium]